MRIQYTQEADFRQHRDFGQKITATFEFISAHWRGLGRALVIIVLPAAIVQGIVSGLMQRELIMGAENSSSLSNLDRLSRFTQSPFYSINILIASVFVVLMVLTVYCYLRLCLRSTTPGEPISVRDVWQGIKEQFLSSFLSYFGLLLLVIIGYALLLIPGIYLSGALSIFFVVKVMEGTGFGDSVSRSLRLTRGKWWSTFLLVVIMGLILTVTIGVIGGIVGAIVGGIGGALGLFSSGSSNVGLFTVVASTLGGLFNILIYPPVLIALAFQYFNLVERHDAVGLRNMVNQLGQTPTTVPNAAYRPDEEGEY